MDEDFIREIAIKRMREGDKKVGKAGKGDTWNNLHKIDFVLYVRCCH